MQGEIMSNVGEELVGAYLRYIHNCDYIEYNVKYTDDAGELDVLGIDIKNKKIYLCEVAIHLTTGLQYNSNKAKNSKRIFEKFLRAKKYADEYFKDYKCNFQLWSPIVKKSQNEALNETTKQLKNKNIELTSIINAQFTEAINRLQAYASEKTSAFNTPAMRTLQILAYLKKTK